MSNGNNLKSISLVRFAQRDQVRPASPAMILPLLSPVLGAQVKWVSQVYNKPKKAAITWFTTNAVLARSAFVGGDGPPKKT